MIKRIYLSYFFFVVFICLAILNYNFAMSPDKNYTLHIIMMVLSGTTAISYLVTAIVTQYRVIPKK